MNSEVKVAIWVVVGLVGLLTVLWLVYSLLERRIVNKTVRGLEPKEAEKARREIKEAIEERGKKVRERIKDFWTWQKTILILSALVALESCASTSLKPGPPIPEDFEKLIEPLEKGCKPQSGKEVLCPTWELKQVLIGASEHFDRMLICERTADIDAQEMVFRVTKAEQERDKAELSKWFWGLGGAGVATILTLLMVK